MVETLAMLCLWQMVPSKMPYLRTVALKGIRMGVVRIQEGSPEYELIRGYREQLEAIRLLCYRAFIDDPPRSKKRYLARAILEIMGIEFTAPNNSPDNSK